MENVRQIIQKLKEKFESGEIFQYLKPELLVTKNGKPSSSWSLCNKLIMLINGTEDSRGYQQWKKVGRNVKKGAKAFGILAPKFIKKTDDRTQEESVILAGFLSVPVFRFEDTDGEPLSEDHFEPETLPDLFDIANAWNIEIKWEGVSNPNQLIAGYYQSRDNKIVLHTYDDYTFLHELIHAAQHKIIGKLKSGQNPQQEFVAEFGAACLARILGIHDEEKEQSSMAYCQSYLSSAKNSTVVILAALSEVEKVINQVLETKNTVTAKAA